MKTTVVKDVFSNEEISDILFCINKELSTRETLEWDDKVNGRVFDQGKKIYIKRRLLARLDMNKIYLPKHILDKVIALAYDLYNLDHGQITNLVSVSYVEYNHKYGNPILVPHKDYGQCGLILDYQLDSNIDWPIMVDGEEFNLKNNELLSLFPLSQYHWRPAIKWENGNFLKMLFFEFGTIGVERIEDEDKRSMLNDKLIKEWEQINNGEKQ